MYKLVIHVIAYQLFKHLKSIIMKENSTIYKIIGTVLFLMTIPFIVFGQNPNMNQNTSAPISVPQNGSNEMFKTYSERNITVTTLTNSYEFPNGISSDYNKVAIQSFDGDLSYLWSDPDQLVEIAGVVFDVSNEGKVCGYFVNESGLYVGGYWINGQWTFLGMHPDYPNFNYDMSDYNSVWCMNESGTVFGGMQWTESWTTFPFIWTEAGGYVNLPTIVPNGTARPNSMNADGSIVGGWSSDANGFWIPVLWINQELVTLSSEYGGEVKSVSANGDFAAGYLEQENTNAFVWNEETGLQVIENTITSGMYASASATCVSNTGEVFGYTNSQFPPFIDTRIAFAKTIDGPMTTFNEYAIARGWTEAVNWTFYSINDVSSDGNIFIGGGVNPEGVAVSFKLSFQEDPILYTLTLASNPEIGGSTFGAGNFEAGQIVEVSAVSNTDYEFTNWTDEYNVIVSEDSTFNYTMPDHNCTLTANFIETTNVDENVLHAVIYPIPASNQLIIQQESNNAKLSIIDIQGRTILEKEITSKIFNLSVDNIANGFYFLRLEANGKQSLSKIQIQK